jgi:hypothetical protein
MGPDGATLTAMSDGQADREQEDFVKDISDDVMRCLTTRGFFEALDNRLCPRDNGLPRALCDHSYKISKSVLAERGFHTEDLDDIFDVLRSKGGSCDCEILYNAVEESRLKAEHWKVRAKEVEESSSQDTK